MFGCFLNYVGVHKPQAGMPGFLKLPFSLRLGINIVKRIHVKEGYVDCSSTVIILA